MGAYIAVESADAIAELVPKLGGTILEPPHEIPGVRQVCMFEDPVMALIYVLQPVTPAHQEARPGMQVPAGTGHPWLSALPRL
jgi:hypothetical protein